MIEVQYRYSRDPENDARHEMNSKKRSQGGDGAKKKRVARKTKVKMLHVFIKIYRDKYLLATRPPALLMFLQLLSRRVVSWSSHSEDDSPLSIPHLVSRWGIAITISHKVILNRRIQYKYRLH